MGKIVILREELLDVCHGDHCAALVMNQMMYWHNIELAHITQALTYNSAHSESKALQSIINTNLWLYKSIPEMQVELMGLFGERKVGAAFQFLARAGILEVKDVRSISHTKIYRFTEKGIGLCGLEETHSRRNAGVQTRKNAGGIAAEMRLLARASESFPSEKIKEKKEESGEEEFNTFDLRFSQAQNEGVEGFPSLSISRPSPTDKPTNPHADPFLAHQQSGPPISGSRVIHPRAADKPVNGPRMPVDEAGGIDVPETPVTGRKSPRSAKAGHSTKAPKADGQFAIPMYFDSFYKKYECRRCHNIAGTVETCEACKGKGHLTPTLTPQDRTCLKWLGREFGEVEMTTIMNNYFSTASTWLYEHYYPVAILKRDINVYKQGTGPTTGWYNQPAKPVNKLVPEALGKGASLKDIGDYWVSRMPQSVKDRLFNGVAD